MARRDLVVIGGSAGAIESASEMSVHVVPAGASPSVPGATATSLWPPRILCPRTGKTCRRVPAPVRTKGRLAHREDTVLNLALSGRRRGLPRTSGGLFF
jgi:hypothetical protein